LREQKLEALAKIVKVDVANGSNGAVDLSIGGVSMVSGKSVADTLQTVDPGNGRLLVQAAGAGTTLNMTGGSLHGTIDARDSAIANTESQVNALAAAMIKEVNAVHATGFSQGGTSGNDFFTGTGAGNIAVNNALVVNPSLIQASGDATAAGNNKVALALAQLGTKPFASLGNQSFAQNYSATVASLGSSLNTVNNQIGDQGVVTQMLKAQRDSSSGVSLDEEMTDLTRYQKAYQASARLINTIDDLLDVALSLKR
jgi:flagellar hook-associated protein 1 FlgK